MFGKERKPDDFRAEVEAHIQLEADRLRQGGMSEEEALATARRAFGNRTAAQERFHETGRWMWWENIRQDLRLAARLLVKTPGWTAVATLTAALGIGAAVAMFSAVYVVVLRPLPYPHPERLFAIDGQGSPSSTDYLVMRENTQQFSEMAAWSLRYPTWISSAGPERIAASEATASFFSVFEVQPLLGRTFRPDESSPGSGPCVILSYRFWQQRFGGDPNVLGQTVRMNQTPAVIVGVMPRGFDFPNSTVRGDPELRDGVDVWIPFLNSLQRGFVVDVLARSKVDVSPARVSAEMVRLSQIAQNNAPERTAPKRFSAALLQERLAGNVRPVLLVFAGAVALMLLIVCFNVANLMLARATARRREIAVRVALGAPRRRIVHQLVIESLLISVLGGVFGLGLAVSAVSALNASRQAVTLGLPKIPIDPWTAAFALGLTVFTGLVFGLAPAFSALGFSVRDALQRESRSATGGTGLRRARKALVVAQLAASLTLLIGAGLLGKSFLQIAMTDPGFQPRNLLTARADVPPQNLPVMVDQLRSLPGVESVALTTAMLGATDIGAEEFYIEGHPGERLHSQAFGVTPEYFQTVGIPVRQGRVFTARDTPNSEAVIVVNEAFTRRFFPNENPVGRRIQSAFVRMCPNSECPWEQIIGVVGDVRGHQLDREPQLMVYESIWQSERPFARGPILRVSSNPGALIPSIQKVIASLSPTQPVYDVKLVEERFSDSLAGRRFNAAVIAVFALTAVFLAAIGLYGVMSYLVMLRSQEMGIRLTLGAQPPQIVAMILREGVVLGLIGVALGVGGALGLSRFLASLLYRVSTLDVATYVAVTAALFGIVLAACYFPGRRAALADPLIVLRHE